MHSLSSVPLIKQQINQINEAHNQTLYKLTYQELGLFFQTLDKKQQNKCFMLTEQSLLREVRDFFLLVMASQETPSRRKSSISLLDMHSLATHLPKEY